MSHDRPVELGPTVHERIVEEQADERAERERKELLSWTAATALQVASEANVKKQAELDKAVDDELLEVLRSVKKQSEAGVASLTLAVSAHKDAVIDRLTKKGFRYNRASNTVEWGESKITYRDGVDYKQHGLFVSKFRTKYSRRVGGVVIPS